MVAICFFSFLVNEIGDAGVSDIADALKVNNTLNKIDFNCERMVFFVLVSSFLANFFFENKQAIIL